MKLIPLRELSGLKTTEIISTVVSRPGQGATVADIRSGVRLLDAIEKEGKAKQLLLEDADHAALVAFINRFSFGLVSKDLLTIIDDIVNAAEPKKSDEKGKAAA